eukprot:TRINITY_DN317966_c0_g1_i1.p1 TRINITY_DN317966_c0_g1~~TRINITY_DN317966_c0_g1_i1.p1  ORF type:complete len:222 (-),score=54.04 TRINITY_DN317966_c0_g1_i1:983-1648(-)
MTFLKADSQLKSLFAEKALYETLLAIFGVLFAFSAEAQTGYALFFLGHVVLSAFTVALIFAVPKASSTVKTTFSVLLFFNVLLSIGCLVLDSIATLHCAWGDWSTEEYSYYYYYEHSVRIAMPAIFIMGALMIISLFKPLVWIPLIKMTYTGLDEGGSSVLPVTINDPSLQQQQMAAVQKMDHLYQQESRNNNNQTNNQFTAVVQNEGPAENPNEEPTQQS